MKVHVWYFAQVAEKLGKAKELLEVQDGLGSDELDHLLKQKYPILNELSYNIAVDQTMVKKNTILENEVEVALLPPFAGG